jgi:hypothetical protein
MVLRYCCHPLFGNWNNDGAASLGGAAEQLFLSLLLRTAMGLPISSDVELTTNPHPPCGGGYTCTY